jgi:hypothetical protein
MLPPAGVSNSLFVHGQEAEPAVKLGKEVGKTKRRTGSKYAFRLRVNPTKHMYSGGLEPTVNRIALREASRYNTKDQVADGNAQRSVIVMGPETRSNCRPLRGHKMGTERAQN